MNEKERSNTQQSTVNNKPVNITADDQSDAAQTEEQTLTKQANPNANTSSTKQVGGPKGLEPTRYGDWESKGRCYDF